MNVSRRLNQYRAFENYITYLAVGSMLLMMIFISLNGMMRYLFNSPVSGILEITELYFMIIILYSTLPYIQREGNQINVDIFSRNFGPTEKFVRDVISIPLTIFVFILVLYITFEFALEASLENASSTGALDLPIAPSWWFVVLGVLLLIIRLILQLRERIKKFRNRTRSG